ncbi:MAG: hypothetical protein ACLFVO_07115 [Chloroflexaceae bacterium]
MTSTTFIHDQAAGPEQSPLIIERFLRDSQSVRQQISSEYRLNQLIRQMLVSATLALAGYGALVGSQQSLLQALASSVKLPVLFLLTLAICLPTLYLFNLLCGGRLSARQALATALTAITVTSNLTLAFAPITLFFMLTAQSYAFFVLLNVVILALTGGIGLHFMVQGIRSLNTTTQTGETLATALERESPAARSPHPVNMTLLNVWLLLYGFVGTQLGWTLSPFFGEPDMPFILFREIDSNFYIGVLELFFRLFS